MPADEYETVIWRPDAVVHTAHEWSTPDWLAIRDGRIVRIGSGARPRASSVVDAYGMLVTPGLVNSHHHIFQNLARAYAPAIKGGLKQWLHRVYQLWPHVSPDDMYEAAWVGIAELLLGGCTASVDHLSLPPARDSDLGLPIMRAVAETGIRLQLVRGYMDTPSNPALRGDWETYESTIRRLLKEAEFTNATGGFVGVAVAAATLLSTSPGALSRIREVSESLALRRHIHIAEAADEEHAVGLAYGTTGVARLNELDWLGPSAWIAHGVHVSEADVQLLASTHTGVAHCPSSNMILGNGIAPVSKLREAGVAVGIGTDGSASADHASMLLEARMALLAGRARHGAESIDAAGAFEMATTGSATCVGLPYRASVHEGSPADLVLWRMDTPQFAGAVSNPVEALLRTAPHSAHHVWIGGRQVVSGGDLCEGDLGDHLERHRRAALRVQSLDKPWS